MSVTIIQTEIHRCDRCIVGAKVGNIIGMIVPSKRICATGIYVIYNRMSVACVFCACSATPIKYRGRIMSAECVVCGVGSTIGVGMGAALALRVLYDVNIVNMWYMSH